jgi:hypothetical protein
MSFVSRSTNGRWRGRVPWGDAGANIVGGEVHDELARVEWEGAGVVKAVAAVVGREAHPKVGLSV